MKRFFLIIGVILLAIVVILNICFTANLDASEHITISYNNIIYILGILLIGAIIYLFANWLNKFLYKDDKRKKLRKRLFIAALVIYIVADILWTIFVWAPIVGDQVEVAMMGKLFYKGYDEEILQSGTYAGTTLKEYIQSYPQQIPLSFIYSLFFKLIHFDGIAVLRVPNVFAVIAIVAAVYKIGNMLSKKYKVNKVLLLILMLTFVSIPMLSTFIYGDLPSLAFSLFSVYYMMKFVEYENNNAEAKEENLNKNVGAICFEKKPKKYSYIKYAVIASAFSMLAYMMRMNSLIFIIATVIYLLFNLFTKIKSKTAKQNIINVLVIVMYIAISLIPARIVNNYYMNKYNLDSNKTYPNISYFLMAMSESSRGNGWYNESIGEPALKDPQGVKDEYANRIKDRLTYFAQDMGYTFRFYTMKLASMWAENTYSAVRLNLLHESEDDYLNAIKEPLTFYQKALLILMCVCSIIVLIQNRKNLSPEIIYLLLIFMGGFAFHILWEAKSRYIIPYIVVLIPIASVHIFAKKSKNKVNID